MTTIKDPVMSKFGLLGKNIDYSFSRAYFKNKFEKENLDHTYENFDIPSLDSLPGIISKINDLKGFNVTIPYKEKVIPYLDEIEKNAAIIGAVNTIKVLSNKTLFGYNTDFIGFEESLKTFLPLKKNNALILGTGGASKAVGFALKNLGFNFNLVSRKRSQIAIAYSDLDKKIIGENLLIVNCTPLGTFPNTSLSPPIPYEYLTKDHLLYDLIYNPAETEFLKQGKLQGSNTKNGLEMLEIQAEKAWMIWNENN